MSATNSQIRTAITDALAQIAGLQVYAYPVDAISVPAAVVTDLEHKFSTFDRGRESAAEVTVVVSKSHVDQMAELDRLLDTDRTGSVVDVLEDITDTGGVSVAVVTVGGFAEIIVGDVPYYAATVGLKVWT